MPADPNQSLPKVYPPGYEPDEEEQLRLVRAQLRRDLEDLEDLYFLHGDALLPD